MQSHEEVDASLTSIPEPRIQAANQRSVFLPALPQLDYKREWISTSRTDNHILWQPWSEEVRSSPIAVAERAGLKVYRLLSVLKKVRDCQLSGLE